MAQLFMRRPDLVDLPAQPALPDGYTLRRARSDDDAAIADVMVSAFGPDWSADRVRQELLEAQEVEQTFVVAFDGSPVATASARLAPDAYPGSGYIHWVATHEAHREKGLGTVVTLAVLHRFRELGCRDAVLETDAFWLPAIRTYLRLGFRPEPVAPEHEAVWHNVFTALEQQVGQANEPDRS